MNPYIVGPVLEFLSAEDLCVLACVSKRWKQEASHNMYWKKLFSRVYNLPIPDHDDHRYEHGFIKKLFENCTPRVGDLMEVCFCLFFFPFSFLPVFQRIFLFPQIGC